MATCRSRFAAGAAARPSPPSPNAAVAAFAWLRPAPAPAGWARATLAAGVGFAYPPGWKAIAGDRGTATAARLDSAGHYLGYLNLTPRQGGEQVAGWAAFRARHNRAEGERAVRVEDTAAGLRFRTGRGTCVRDAYTTVSGVRYEELACLVSGSRASWVIVGAALQQSWPRERASIETAISAMTS